MAGIDLPGPDRLPAGPNRDLVGALHELYRGAGKPSTREIAQAVMRGDFRSTISHETVAAMLRGDGGLPRWAKLEAVVRILATWNTSPLDPDAEAARMQRLWHAVQDHRPAVETPEHTTSPPGITAVSQAPPTAGERIPHPVVAASQQIPDATASQQQTGTDQNGGVDAGNHCVAERHEGLGEVLTALSGGDAAREDLGNSPAATATTARPGKQTTAESLFPIYTVGRLTSRYRLRRPRISAGKTARRRNILWPVAAVIVVAVAIAAYDGWPRHKAGHQPPQAKSQPGAPTQASASYPGTVQIAVKSLLPTLAANLGRSAADTDAKVTGFRLKNASRSGSLCLNANTTGFTAGRNGDEVELWRCDAADSEIWIPVQWEKSRRKFTWLANYKYQSKCLNADDIGNLAKGRRLQLWDCYNTPNEYWDFGDWHDRANPETSPYPIFLESSYFCLDADKYHISMGNGDPVHIWNYYGPPNQLWY